MPDLTPGASVPNVTHHRAHLGGGALHYVRAGSGGSPVLLVHGFPETWWAFHKLIPRLAAQHRVIAVDLPGFGDSETGRDGFSSSVAADSLRELIAELDLGPVHLTGQDISGPTCFRLAATHPELVASFAAIETGLPGYGWEGLADVAHGGAWHIGVLAAPGIPEMLLQGRERDFLGSYAYPSLCATDGAFTGPDLEEFTRTFARPDGFAGAAGLYRSALVEGEELRGMVSHGRLTMPVLAVGAGGGDFTRQTMAQVCDTLSEITLDGVGHYVAMEAPAALADALLGFYRGLDG